MKIQEGLELILGNFLLLNIVGVKFLCERM